MTNKEFEQQFIPLSGALFNYLKSICRDQHLVEDVVQEVYLKLWQKRKQIDHVKDARAYIFKTGRNKLIDTGYYKHRIINYNDELINDNIEISYDNIVKSIEQKEMVSILLKFMDQLPAIQKELIHLRDFCCFNNDEVANIIGESEVYVRVNLSRGRKKLKEMMMKNFQIEEYEIR